MNAATLLVAHSTSPYEDADHAGLAVENGVAHLSGQVDSMHGVLALRRIAAAIPRVTAIIDDLWIPCE